MFAETDAATAKFVAPHT